MHVFINYLRIPALCLLGAVVGFIGWNGDVTALLLLPLMVWIWRTCNSRLSAFCALFAYYAAASRGMLLGASVFFSGPQHAPIWWIGLSLWLLSSALLASTWAICWGNRFKGARLLFIILILSLPPLGLIGWANPLTAAGAYFPGLGWYGLAALLTLLFVIAQAPRPTLLLPFIFVAGCSYTVYIPASPVVGWSAINTKLSGNQDIGSEFDRLTKLQTIVRNASKLAAPGAVMLLPELVGGDWSVNALWWNDIERVLREKRQSLLLGVYHPTRGQGYMNSLIGIGAASGTELQDRVPIPIAMWKPWSEDGAVASWGSRGSAQIDGKRIAHVICYEQLLVWPILLSMVDSPEMIVAASNVWWANKTSVPAIQNEVVAAWGTLFNIPVLFASNT